MDFNLLNRRFTKMDTLTEADDSRYGISDDVFNSNDAEDDEALQDNDAQVNEQDQQNDQQEGNVQQEENQDDQQEDDYADDEYYDDDELKNNSDESQEQDNINSIPKLEILNLPDKDKKLNNLLILRKFKDLARSANENLNNNIINMTAMTKKQSQLIDIVCDNVNKMINSINDYILYKFDDVYEENVVVYNAFLKRYKIAMELIREIVDEQSKETNGEN